MCSSRDSFCFCLYNHWPFNQQKIGNGKLKFCAKRVNEFLLIGNKDYHIRKWEVSYTEIYETVFGSLSHCGNLVLIELTIYKFVFCKESPYNVCPKVYNPICADNEETFLNQCLFDKRNSIVGGKALKKVYHGLCEGI